MSNIAERLSMMKERQEAGNAFPNDPPLLALLFEETIAGLAVVDRDLRFLRVNARMALLNGIAPEGYVGRSLPEMLPGLAPLLQSSLHRVLESGRPLIHQEITGVLHGGVIGNWTASFYPMSGDPETIERLLIVLQETSSDVRARQQAEQKAERLEARDEMRAIIMETATRVATDILANRTGMDALKHIAEAAQALSGARYAALGVARPDGQGLQGFITVGLSERAEAAIGPRPRGVGVLGLLLTRTEPLRIDDLSHHSASVGFPPNHPPMHSFLGVPIRRGDTAIGSLYLTEKVNGGSFTEADEIAIQSLGAHAAIAIHNLQMLERQRMLLSGLINAQEEERRAVAYELHDGLTQFVMASHAHLESFRRAQTDGNTARAAREIDLGLNYLKEAVTESRRLVNGLRALALDDLGLAGALEQLISEEKARAGWTTIDFLHNIAGCRYDRVMETSVYRVIQEALTNARKHAQTERIQISLLAAPHPVTNIPQLAVQVRDWGVGFRPEEKMNLHGHLGLHGMSERVHVLGGMYEISSAPGEGTLIHATFPILDRAPQEDEVDQ